MPIPIGRGRHRDVPAASERALKGSENVVRAARDAAVDFLALRMTHPALALNLSHEGKERKRRNEGKEMNTSEQYSYTPINRIHD